MCKKEEMGKQTKIEESHRVFEVLLEVEDNNTSHGPWIKAQRRSKGQNARSNLAKSSELKVSLEH